MIRRAPLRRTGPLRRGAGLRRTGPPAARSSRRDDRDDGYDQARQAVVARAAGRCEARACGGCHGLPGSRGCCGTVDQTHHLAGRLGDDPHRLDNLLGVCTSCHEHIHARPSEAIQRGWSTSRLNTEGTL